MNALMIVLEIAGLAWAGVEIRRWLSDYVDHVVYGNPEVNRRIMNTQKAPIVRLAHR